MCAQAKYAEFQIDRSVDFIRGLKFWSRTNSESSQNCRSIAVLLDSVAWVEAENLKKLQWVLFACTPGTSIEGWKYYSQMGNFNIMTQNSILINFGLDFII